MKALVAAAVVATTMSGAANALTNNEIFLVAYDATAAKTFIAALGQAGTAQAFTGSSNLSVNYAADANWTNLMSTATAGSVTYQVLGISYVGSSGYNAADKLVLTSNGTPGPLNNSAFNQIKSDAQPTGAFLGLFETLNSSITGTSTGLVAGGGSDSGFAVGSNFFTKYPGSLNTTATLDTSLNFWGVTRNQTVTTNPGQSLVAQYLQGAAGSSADTWNLSSTGQLTYTATAATAAVPEADSWAMAMLGLGLMGFVARRRTRA